MSIKKKHVLNNQVLILKCYDEISIYFIQLF